MNKKLKRKLIIISSIVLLLIILFFTYTGFYKAKSCEGKKQTTFILKVKNPNMNLNFLKPSADFLLDYSDKIVYKSPELSDPPFSKKENIIGRVIGKPGDIVEIRDTKILINNKELNEDYDLMFKFRVNTEEETDFAELLKNHDVKILDTLLNNKACDILTYKHIADEISKLEGVMVVRRITEPEAVLNYNTFPFQIFPWNQDFFGPTVVPCKDMTLSLNRRNIHLYKKIIDFYEGHALYYFGENIEIDKNLVDKYIVEKNYYFVLSDNRLNGKDSRRWGFIPEEYIIGKIAF
jgi:signal peptidase I